MLRPPSPMRLPVLFAALAALLVSRAAQAQTPPAQSGPVIQLAPEDREPPKKPEQPLVSFGAGHAPEGDVLGAGMAEQRFRAAIASLGHTSIGGYGELAVTGLKTEGTPMQWTADA